MNWHITKNGEVRMGSKTLGTCEELERNVQAYALAPRLDARRGQ